MRTAMAVASTDTHGHTTVRLYFQGHKVELDLALGEHTWAALHRAWDQSGLAGVAHFERFNVHVTPRGVLVESWECLTEAVAS